MGTEQVIFGIVKVNTKGQVIIPADLREELNIKEGDQLVAAKNSKGDGILLLKVDVLNEMLLRSKSYESE